MSAAKRIEKKVRRGRENVKRKKRERKDCGINYGRLLRRVSMYVLLFFAFVVPPCPSFKFFKGPVHSIFLFMT
jgi:hypothetical protein